MKNTRPLPRMVFAAVLSLSAALLLPFQAQAQNAASTDILVLGDSQLSFGSGPAFLDFFSDIEGQCGPDAQQREDLKRLGRMRVGVLGVRSTSVPSWTARSGKFKDEVCAVDPNWNVNASAYGTIETRNREFVQMGQGRNFQFCEPGETPFESMFQKDYYDPKLLLLSFLGNSARRWAESKEATIQDVEDMMAQIPADVPCIFLSTAPAHTPKIANLRIRAQINLEAAFKETGSRCTFIAGLTPETIAANQGSPQFFRQDEEGKVKDPFHPNDAGARHFLSLKRGEICNAIFQQIGD